MKIEDALLEARNATGDTLLVLVSPRQAERLYLAMQIADGVIDAESIGHNTGIKGKLLKRYQELSK